MYERPERGIERLDGRLGRLEQKVDKLIDPADCSDALSKLEQLIRQDQMKVKDRVHMLNSNLVVRRALHMAEKNRTLLNLQVLLIGFVEWCVSFDISEDAMMVGCLHLIDGLKYQKAWYDK